MMFGRKLIMANAVAVAARALMTALYVDLATLIELLDWFRDLVATARSRRGSSRRRRRDGMATASEDAMG